MKTWVVFAFSLWLGTAYAADRGEQPPSPDPWDGDGVAQTDPLTAAQEKREAEEKAREERLKALEAAQAEVAAKVIVLAWPGAPHINYEHGGLLQNVKGRIARPDAQFYPEIDLYQVGRRMPDPSVAPGDQVGSVPPESIDSVMAAVNDIKGVPWNGMSEADWGITANNLRAVAEDIWFVDRPELREPLFLLYAQIGRAAENMNNPVAPFYQHIGGQLLNYYWHLAGTLAFEDPAILDSLESPEMKESIGWYRDQVAAGAVPMISLSFEQGGTWDAKKFAGEYQVFINGLEVLITDPQSLHRVPPGRVDVYLKRTDGSHSISDRIELDKLDGKIYFVRDVARKRMGIDFIDQLMEHPNECSPRIDGDILTDLAIYATLHPTSEIYAAVPVAGDPSKTLLWRWNREAKTLTKVLDETGGYPIRFAGIVGAGATFSGGNVPTICEPNPIPGEPDICRPGPPELAPAGIPVQIQLRGHYSRLMVLFGAEFALPLGEDPLTEYYQTDDGHKVVDGTGTDALKEFAFSRLIYTGAGVVFGRKAAMGFGPRGYVRAGWNNAPHTIDLTLHGGLTSAPPGMEDAEGRARLLVDADAFIGTLIPFGDSVLDSPALTFGLLLGAGTTF